MFSFVGLMIWLVFDMYGAPDAPVVDVDKITRVKVDEHLITAFAIIVFAFNIQFMVFPAYVDMEKRSTERFSWSSLYWSAINGTAYMTTAVCGVLLFGSEI